MLNNSRQKNQFNEILVISLKLTLMGNWNTMFYEKTIGLCMREGCVV